MQYYNGRPATTAPSIGKKRLSPFMLLIIILPLLLIVVVGAIIITISNANAAANTNAPIANKAGTTLTSNANMSTTTTTATTATTGTTATNTVTANPTSVASTTNTNNTNSTGATTNNTNKANTGATTTATNNTNTKPQGNTQMQSFTCNVNGTMIAKCSGKITITLQNGTPAACALAQGNNLVTLNCPSDQMNNQNTNMNGQQPLCEVNGAMVDGCNGLATIAFQNDSATCSLARANTTITMICPAVRNTQQNGAATPTGTPPPHMHW